MRFLHSYWPVRVGFGVLLLVEILGVLNIIPIEPEFTWKGMIIQNVVIWTSLEAVRVLIKRHKLDMSAGPSAQIITVQLIVDAIGDMGHLYARFNWYDQIMHFTGGMAAALMTTALIQAIHKRHKHRLFPLAEVYISGFALSMVGQVLYELEEYIEDVLTGSNRLGDGFDTANDLMLGMFGALLAALIVVKIPRLTSKK